MGPEGVGRSFVRAVYLRQVEKGRDGVDLLARAAGARAGARIELGPGEGQGVGTDRIPRRNRDGERGAAVRGEIHVVVHELPERVTEVGQALLIDGVDVL